MPYKVKGRPLTHDEMVEIVKSKEPRLYAIYDNKKVVGIHATCITINLETKEWELNFREQEWFEKGEIIFPTKRSAWLELQRRKRNGKC